MKLDTSNYPRMYLNVYSTVGIDEFSSEIDSEANHVQSCPTFSFIQFVTVERLSYGSMKKVILKHLASHFTISVQFYMTCEKICLILLVTKMDL